MVANKNFTFVLSLEAFTKLKTSMREKSRLINSVPKGTVIVVKRRNDFRHYSR